MALQRWKFRRLDEFRDYAFMGRAVFEVRCGDRAAVFKISDLKGRWYIASLSPVGNAAIGEIFRQDLTVKFVTHDPESIVFGLARGAIHLLRSNSDAMPETIAITTAGRCGRCGHKLASIGLTCQPVCGLKTKAKASLNMDVEPRSDKFRIFGPDDPIDDEIHEK